MIVFSLVFLAVALILIGIGLVVGFVLLAASVLAVALGIVSTSAALGVLQKRVSTGLRALLYQVFLVVFALAGVGVALTVSLLWNLHFDGMAILLLGGLPGITVGLLFGLLSSWLLDVAIRQIEKFFARSAMSSDALRNRTADLALRTRVP